MKTEDLIEMLASGPDVGVARPPARAIVLPLAGGLLLSALVMLTTLGLRPDLLQAAQLAAFWGKLAFSAALAGAGWLAMRRLSTPGAATARLPLYLGGPVLLIWAVALVALLQAAPELRGALFWGRTWRYCPILIALLSIPVFIATLHVMRTRAPTRLRLAGAAAGFAAGAAAAVVYCLHCPEMAAPFVGFWYLLGMLIPAGVGAVIGPRVLRW